MSLAGAFLGFAIGFLTTSLLYNGDKASLYSLLVGIAAAVLFSILSFKVYRLGLFIWAVVMAYGPVSSFISIDNFIARNVAAVAVSVLIAVFVVKFQYAWIIAVTAVAGGFNASAFLGGKVQINTGLFVYSDTEDEFASVLAHEISHVTQRHIARFIESEVKKSNTSIASMVGAIALSIINPAVGMAALSTSLGIVAPNRILEKSSEPINPAEIASQLSTV